MSTVTGFANLTSGSRFNLNTPIKLKKKVRRADAQSSLGNYAQHYKTAQLAVPETNVKILDNLIEKSLFKTPFNYIQHTPKKKTEKTVEYDIDEEDCEWISLSNKKRKSENIDEINVEMFEVAIDRMEKCCKFEPKNAMSSSNQMNSDEESDDVCCVCADGDVSNANQIIYCDMCNIAVHQDCYGVPYIPEGSWLCRKCKLSPSEPVKCCLCPHPFGAFKPTSDGRWAHVVCAIWLNEVHFANAVFLEPVEGVRECLKERKILRCLYCRNKHGACIQCSSRSCIKAFHVTCAQQLGLAMKVETVQDEQNGEEVDVKRFVYCQKHASGNNMTKKEIEMSIRKARRSMEASGAYRPVITMPTISKENVDRIAKETKIANFDEIVVYWYLKRRSRAGVPLIRRLNVEILPKEKKSGSGNGLDMSVDEKKAYEKFRTIRNSLETTRLLSEQAKKREKNKKMYMNLHRKLLETALMPLEVMLEDVINQLVEKDSKKVFHEPVDVAGYRSVISKPMDLSTMRKKIRTYRSIEALRDDVVLMTQNCAKFNHDNEYYFKYGKRFHKTAMMIVNEAERRWNELEAIRGAKSDDKFWSVLCAEMLEMYGGKARMDENMPSTSKEVQEEEQEDAVNSDSDEERKKSANRDSWKALFKGGEATPTNKRKMSVAGGTSAKRKKDAATMSSILPFLTPKSQQYSFSTIAQQNQTMISPRSSRRGSARSAQFSGRFRESSVLTSPVPGSASSTECSTDEDVMVVEKPLKLSNKKRSVLPKMKQPSAIEKARREIQSKFAHNALVNVDGKAAKVIDVQYAHLSDISKEQRQQMIASRPNRNGSSPKSRHSSYGHENDELVYVEFFQKTNVSEQYKWVPSERVTLLDMSNIGKSKIAGIKAAREWQQAILNKTL